MTGHAVRANDAGALGPVVRWVRDCVRGGGGRRFDQFPRSVRHSRDSSIFYDVSALFIPHIESRAFARRAALRLSLGKA